jgi:hypothetical protein
VIFEAIKNFLTRLGINSEREPKDMNIDYNLHTSGTGVTSIGVLKNVPIAVIALETIAATCDESSSGIVLRY